MRLETFVASCTLNHLSDELFESRKKESYVQL